MGKTTDTSRSKNVSTKQAQIAELAKKMPGVVLTTLAHHIDKDWLYVAYEKTRKDSAAGVDGQTAVEYAADLDSNLESLLNRAKTGETYRAPPVRRVYIPKGKKGERRPIGVPTFEDKVLQRAVVMVLEAVYEQDFLDCSYGFRPGRSQHDALDVMWKQTMGMGGGWLLSADIESFFDSVDRKQLRQVLQKRVRDGVLLRLIGKWMRAGVMDEGCVYHPETGMPQGGVISPLLANIFLHDALDTWFEGEVKPRLRGRVFFLRFADDVTMLFEREDDARRVLAVLPKRLGKYGLRLHLDKTRLVPFQRPMGPNGPRPGTFDLLGFTHFWGKSRKGLWVVKRKTMRSRFTRTVRRLHKWCRANMHEPIKQQHATLCQKLRGHDAYYGITGNFAALASLRHRVERIWRKWLSRRSRKGRLSWKRMREILRVFPLAKPRIVHSALRPAAKP